MATAAGAVTAAAVAAVHEANGTREWRETSKRMEGKIITFPHKEEELRLRECT